MSHRGAGVAAALAAGVLAACDAPRWRASAEPADATLIVDGEARAASRLEAPIPYYGVVDLSAVPAPGSAPPRRAARTELRIDEPVTPWIFPLDFVVESLNTVIVGDRVPEATLAAPVRDDVPSAGAEPEDVLDFLERGRRKVTER